MKPRRLRLSVDLLPTISETQEEDGHEWHPGHRSPSPGLEDYVASIKELARPAAGFSTYATPRVLGHPKHALLPARPSPRVHEPRLRLPVALDDVTLAFDAGDRDRGEARPSPAAGDPLDWLFRARAERDGHLPLPPNPTAALCLL